MPCVRRISCQRKLSFSRDLTWEKDRSHATQNLSNTTTGSPDKA